MNPPARLIVDLAGARARAAMDAVASVQNRDLKQYRSAVRRFGSLVQTSGLLQAAAFYKDRGADRQEYVVLGHIANWLAARGIIPRNTDFVEWLINTATQEQAVLAQSEALSFVVWLKRCVEPRYTDLEAAAGGGNR